MKRRTPRTRRDPRRPLRPTVVWSAHARAWFVYWGSKRLPRAFETQADARAYAERLVNPYARTGERDRKRRKRRTRRRRP